MSGPPHPDDEDLGPTAFIPDLDDFYEEAEVDEEAYAEMEAEHLAMEARMMGQSTPRKLDFAAYGLADPIEGSTDASQAQPRLSQIGTAPLMASQSQLALDLFGEEDDDDFEANLAYAEGGLPSSSSHRGGAAAPARPLAPPAVAPLSHFERERAADRAAEAKRVAASGGASHPLATPSSGGAVSVLPPLHRSISDLRAKVLHDDRLYVYRRAPVVGEFISMTNERGERVFLTMETAEDSAAKLAAHSALHRTQHMRREVGGQVNVRRILAQLEAESTAASMEASKVEAAARELESDPEDDERTRVRKRRLRKERLVARLDAQDARERASARNRHLWVDKYAPKGYGDLLSPEVRTRRAH